jgi:hypothetical protein
MKKNLLSMLFLMYIMTGYTSEAALAQSDETSSNKQLSAQVKSNKSPVIGVVKYQPESGYLCWVQTFKDFRNNNKDRLVFLWDTLNFENPAAIVNIDGSDVVFHNTKQIQKGSGGYSFYSKKGNISIRVDQVFNGSNNISYNLNTTILVTRGGRKSTIRGIGGCG